MFPLLDENNAHMDRADALIDSVGKNERQQVQEEQQPSLIKVNETLPVSSDQQLPDDSKHPSGQEITMRSLDFWRVEGDLIRENWVLVDLLDVYYQLGVDVFARLRGVTSIICLIRSWTMV